jgi:hypothetical protein
MVRSPPFFQSLVSNPNNVHSRNLEKSITQSERDEAIRKVNVYKKWFLQEILHEGTRNSFIILPIPEVAPNYRDTQPG